MRLPRGGNFKATRVADRFSEENLSYNKYILRVMSSDTIFTDVKNELAKQFEW